MYKRKVFIYKKLMNDIKSEETNKYQNNINENHL
jgi:hypothetical protein